MEYTKNYHLPQWVKSDRIMMDDFNDAMARLENGLTSAMSSVQNVSGDVEQASRIRLRRMAYDLCQTAIRCREAGIPAGHAKGLAYNGLTSDEEKGHCSGMIFANGGAQLGPATALTMSALNNNIISYENGVVDSVLETGTATIRFRSPGQGTITALQVWFHDDIRAGCTPELWVRLYDVAARKYTYTLEKLKTSPLAATVNERVLPVEIPLETGKEYRLEVLIGSYISFSGRLGFGKESKESFIGEITGIPYQNGTITERLTLDSPSNQAVAVVHYTGGDSLPSLTVNGQTMAAQATRQTTSAAGKSCTEREYYLEGSWSGTVPLTAVFRAVTESLTVYDLAFYLI